MEGRVLFYGERCYGQQLPSGPGTVPSTLGCICVVTPKVGLVCLAIKEVNLGNRITQHWIPHWDKSLLLWWFTDAPNYKKEKVSVRCLPASSTTLTIENLFCGQRKGQTHQARTCEINLVLLFYVHFLDCLLLQVIVLFNGCRWYRVSIQNKFIEDMRSMRS